FFLVACKEAPENVVIAGDSWAFFTCNNQSLDLAFKNAGLEKIAATNSDCAATTMPDIRAENWLVSKTHILTLLALQNPDVKVLYLSLGGNDLINHWNKGMSYAEEQRLFKTVQDHLTTIIAIYKKTRPDLKILISGYDYPRFNERTLVPPYQRAYELMGKPTPEQINQSLIQFSDSMTKYVNREDVFYIHHLGLMQYYFGNPSQGLAAFQTLPPDQISSKEHPAQYGGDPRLQTDEAALLSVNKVVDSFHLSKSGYNKLADHAVQIYLKDWF
ncbi:MAG: hypothetical protein H7326_03575, partial [Bdellovibrionaceae bacterium]|nr:hypothetical protein [Pseudobdellovibrionaceae bacterium]